MEMPNAITALQALAQPARLTLFRLLVQAGPKGLAAGQIARHLNLPPSSLSTQLRLLAEGGLITCTRQGRSLIYAADMAGMARLLEWLMQDCCGGKPETCAPVIAQIICACPKERLHEPSL
jgi:ArsR family transcriptional regulator, arsenate/arsenite/antimonite-responsive transcriptional repressor